MVWGPQGGVHSFIGLRATRLVATDRAIVQRQTRWESRHGWRADQADLPAAMRQPQRGAHCAEQHGYQRRRGVALQNGRAFEGVGGGWGERKQQGHSKETRERPHVITAFEPRGAHLSTLLYMDVDSSNFFRGLELGARRCLRHQARAHPAILLKRIEQAVVQPIGLALPELERGRL